MKSLAVSLVALLSIASAAQAAPVCNWATTSQWTCGPATGSGDGVLFLMNSAWTSATLTSDNVSGTFNLVSSDAQNDIYKDDKNDVLSMALNACSSSESFDVVLNGQTYSCE